MRRLLIAAALVVALPLAATADTCIGTTLGSFEQGSGVQMGELIVDHSPVRVEVVGTFLWVQINDGEILSVEVPTDANGFTACESGEVTFTFPQTAEDEISTPDQPAPIVVDIVEMWRPFLPGSPL